MNKVTERSRALKQSKMDFRFNCELIKEEVEHAAGIYDIGLKQRTEYIRDCRYAYYNLCKYFSKDYFSLQVVADVLDIKCHATVINGLKAFDFNYGKKYFKANKVYSDALIQCVKQISLGDRRILRQIKEIRIRKKHLKYRMKINFINPIEQLELDENYLISQMKVTYEMV